MSEQSRRPFYEDYQAPPVYRAGCLLRRSYLMGPANSVEETMMKRLLERYDEDRTATTVLSLVSQRAPDQRG